MLRRNKLDCSVSDEISNFVMQHLIKLKVYPEEAQILSRKYKNIKLALQNLSMPLSEYSKNLQHKEQKKNQEKKISEEKKVNQMSSSKKQIYNKLIELRIDHTEAELTALNCDTIDEALHNLGLSYYPLNKKKEALESGSFVYSSKRGLVEKCSICLEVYENKVIIRSLPCMHRFHKECIDRWISDKKNRCPECNSEIKYESN